MTRRLRLAVLGLMFCLVSSTGAAEPFEIIPADALGGAACRSIEGLVKKSTQFIKDAEIKVPEQPGAICKEVFGYLGIKTGLDTRGGCALVVVNKKHIGADLNIGFFGGRGNLQEFVVIAVPFTDIDAMAENFGIGKGKLKPETMFDTRGDNLPTKLGYVKGKYIYLGCNEKAILSVVKGKSVGEDLSAERRKALGEADCLAHLGTEVWGKVWKDIVRDVTQRFEHLKDDAERKTATELVQTLASVRHVFCACKLNGGCGCSCVCVFPKEGNEAAKKFINTLRAGDGASSLRGLPEGNVVAATAARGDGSKNGHVARVLFDLLHRDVFEWGEVFGAADRPAVLAIFNEIWPHLRGSRFAVYKTAEERKLGLFSAVGILDVDDPDKFLARLKSLARLGSAEGLDLSDAGKEKTEAEIKQLIEDLGARRFQTRESATARLLLAGEQVLPYLEKALKSTDLETQKRAERIKAEIVQAAEARRKELLSGKLAKAIKPSFAFLDRKETVEGFEVYQVAVKLSKRDAAMAPQLRQLFGPDWTRVRIGVQGKQVVVLAGSDVKLLGEALRNLKDDKAGLASSAVLGDQAKKTESARKIEFHASLAMVRALATAADLEKPEKVPANPPLTTVAVTVEEDRLQCDVWLPIPEIKVIAKSAE